VRIECENIGKRFQGKWLFRNLNLCFQEGERVAITGQNGSGKSTFTQIVSGFLSPTEGKMNWMLGDQNIPVEEVWKHLSWCSPLIELPGSLSVEEVVQLQMKMREMEEGNMMNRLEEVDLLPHAKKKIEDLSSGMIQRLKLLLAFNTKSEIVILDEPASHLDRHWQNWLSEQLNSLQENRLAFIASNDHPLELKYCTKRIEISPDAPIVAGR
jgi:ABC-type multidrug transport system ATPase subunit